MATEQFRKPKNKSTRKVTESEEMLVDTLKSIHKEKQHQNCWKYDQKHKDLIFRAINQGMRACDITRLTGIPQTNISRWVNQARKENIFPKKDDLKYSSKTRAQIYKKSMSSTNQPVDGIRILTVNKGEQTMTEPTRKVPLLIFKIGKLKFEMNIRWGE